MALVDIIQRIQNDGSAEADALIADAHARAQAALSAARAAADLERAAVLEAARKQAAVDAETIRASARLAARDGALAAKRALIDTVFDRVREAIVGLDDEAYARLLAARVVAVARGGERVLIAASDAARLAARMPGAVAAVAGASGGVVPQLEWPDEPAPVGHGVLLVGERVSVDLSVDAIIREREDELAILAAERLFGGSGV